MGDGTIVAFPGRAAAMDAGNGAGEAPALGDREARAFNDNDAPPSVAVSNTATESHGWDQPPQIDWLTVAQVHHRPVPLVGSTLMLFCDVGSGEIESQAVKGLQFEGSYDSRLMVRCDGRRVEVSGNPSRFGRRDNVFGLTSVDECIELYNGVLARLGLPTFDIDDRTRPAQLQGYGQRKAPRVNPLRGVDMKRQPRPESDRPDWLPEGSDGVVGVSEADYKKHGRSAELPAWLRDEVNGALRSNSSSGGTTALAEHGCRIKRIDLCVSYQVGSADDARRSIRALSSVSHAGKPGLVYPDGCTVSWGQGSRYAYMKYYIKGPEMRKHLPQADEYCRHLTEWAESVGLVRHEVSLKAMALSRMGLDQPSKWTVQQAVEVMSHYSTHQKAGLGVSSFDRIADELIQRGVKANRAQKAQQAAYAYLSGHQFIIGHNISRSEYYRLQADLRRVGVNIGAPLNVSSLVQSVRVIEWRPAQPPAFYRRCG